MRNIERYLAYLDSRKEKYSVVNNTIYKLYNRMIVPFGAAKDVNELNDVDVDCLFKKFNGVLVRWNKGFVQQVDPQWYCVMQDSFIEVDKIGNNKKRRKWSHALEHNKVEKVDATTIAAQAYNIYVAAFRRYKGNINPVDEETFKRNVLTTAAFDDIVHHWIVFHNHQPVAYAQNIIYDDVECAYNVIKFHPEYLKQGISDALIYRMNEYYLQDHKVEYVNDGFRSLLHESNVQEYLIRKFGFKKQGIKLGLQFNQPYRTIIKSTYPFRNVVGKSDSRLNALYQLEEISRNTK